MVERPIAGARIPESENEAVETTVISDYGEFGRYKASFVESAIRIFLDETVSKEIFDTLDKVDKQLADLFDGFSRRRRSSDATSVPPEWEDGPTTRLTVRINGDLKERFKKQAQEMDLTYGDALARALREYRQNNFQQRSDNLVSYINDQLENITNTNSNISTDTTTGTESASPSNNGDSNPYYEKEKIAVIEEDLADNLNMPSPDEINQFARHDLEPLIHKWCSQQGREEVPDKTLTKYIKKVTDDLGLVEHPNGKLFETPNSDQLVTPATEISAYRNLDREQKIKDVQIEFAQRLVESEIYRIEPKKVNSTINQVQVLSVISWKQREMLMGSCLTSSTAIKNSRSCQKRLLIQIFKISSTKMEQRIKIRTKQTNRTGMCQTQPQRWTNGRTPRSRRMEANLPNGVSKGYNETSETIS